MVEHLLDIAGMIADRAAWMRVRKAEARRVQRDMPAAIDFRQVVRNEAPARRPVTVDYDPSCRVRITPDRETHMPAVSDLSRSDKCG